MKFWLFKVKFDLQVQRQSPQNNRDLSQGILVILAGTGDELYNKKNMCVASLTLIFTRSIGTLQPTRPLGRVGSKFNWPSEDQCQRSHSKWDFVFIPHLECKYSHLILSKLSRKSPICPRWSPWLRIVLVRSLRSARLDTAWLVKSVTYFDLIGYIGGCVREFQRSKYKFSSHPKTLELTDKCGVMVRTS